MSNAPTLLVDAKVQAIFDALLAFMGTTYPTTNAFGNYDGTGTNLGLNCSDYDGNRWTYSEYRQGMRVTIAPAGVSLGPGQTQQFSATAEHADGSPDTGAVFTWSLQAGAAGSIGATGLYTAPATIAAASADTVRCAVDGSNSWSSLSVALHP